jgi:hypothetical protein
MVAILLYMTLFGKSIVGLVLIVGLSAVGYFMMGSPKNESSVEESQQKTSAPVIDAKVIPQESGKKMSFSNFVSQGGAYKCTVSQVVQNIESKGTVYVASKDLLRGDFKTNVSGMSIDSSFVMRDGYNYSWTSAAPTMGFKVKVSASQEGNVETKTSGTYSWNAEQVGEYSCEPWTLDETKFTLPKTITFTSVN